MFVRFQIEYISHTEHSGNNAWQNETIWQIWRNVSIPLHIPTFPKKQRQREKEKKVLISGLHERKTFSIHKIMNISWWYQHLFILMLELMSSRVSALSDVRVYYILHIVYWRCALLLFNSSFSIPFYLLYAFCLSISLFDGSKAVMVV